MLFRSYPGAVKVYNVNCNDRMQVEICCSNSMTVNDGTTGQYFSEYYGPSASHSTAEWIVEKLIGNDNPLANFQSETFYGMGDTDLVTGSYDGPYWQQHDYSVAYDNSGYNLMNIGGLVYNSAYGPPNDSNTITWARSQ